MNRRRLAISSSVALSFWVLTLPVALAQVNPSEATSAQQSNVAKASALFDEAKARWEKKDFAAACKLFFDSEKLDHSMSASYYVARCHEHFGRVASAWGGYVRLADEARRLEKKPQESEARSRVEGVKPRLPYLTLVVSNEMSETAGLALWQDGERVPREVWSNPVPADPGEHVIVVQAPGKMAWSGRVVLVEGKRSTLAIPDLEDAPLSSRETAAVALGALGLAAAATGTVFGLKADATWSDALDVCGDPADHCDPTSFDRASSLEDDARTQAAVATVGLAAGGVALAVATYLWLVDSDNESPSGDAVAIAPAVNEGRWGLELVGRF